MDKNAIKKYAIWARRELIARVSQRAALYEIAADGYGDANAVSVHGRILSLEEKNQRKALIAQIQQKGFEQVMEEIAYTWFNRFSALRFMEVNGYLPSRIRVFTDEENNFKPQIMTEAINLEMDGLDMQKIYAFKTANDDDGLFKYLIISQCNALFSILPGMFQQISDYTELLFPDNLLREGSVVEQMISMIPEEDWTDQVQIIGWLYQYYNTEPKDQVFADLKKNIKITKENIPAATQLFTPDWIVHYMVENSLGRMWLEGHPNDALKSEWKYYIDEAEQEPKVQTQLATIRSKYAALKPEEIRVIDPCMGSGHILCVLFDVLVRIYEDYGFTAREAAGKIVEKNLWGLDIDDRASQLAYFAVMMKARQYDKRFFMRKVQPHVYAIVESNGITTETLRDMGLKLLVEEHDIAVKQAVRLLEEMKDSKEYGSIIHVTPCDWGLLRRFTMPDEEKKQLHLDVHNIIEITHKLQVLINIGEVLAQKYDVVVTNPPYMGSSGMGNKLSAYVKTWYPDTKGDMSTVCMERCLDMCNSTGLLAMINIPTWMFLSSYEVLRNKILLNNTYVNMVHPGRGIFGSDFGTTTFVLAKKYVRGYIASFRRLFNKPGEVENVKVREQAFLSGKGCYYAQQDNFSKIPGAPVAYWASEAAIRCFQSPKNINNSAYPRQGLATGNNDVFLRMWNEVNICDIVFNASSKEEFFETGKKYIPYNKGGAYRKWFADIGWVIRFDKPHYDILQTVGNHLPSKEFYFRESITWSKVTIGNLSMRYIPRGSTFDVAGCSIFADNNLKYILALANSKVMQYLMNILSQTVNYEVGNVKAIPLILGYQYFDEVNQLTKRNIQLSKADLASGETSFLFDRHPLINNNTLVSVAYTQWKDVCKARFEELKANEERLNKILITIYGLEKELDYTVEDEDVSIKKADLKVSIKSLISYAVGCMFGRYSLDSIGVVYAGGEWKPSTYITFPADIDAIIPICDDEYFNDDIVGRFVKFIEVVYGKDTLEENLKFIADVLGGSGTSREVIRNYFINSFYADHLKVYQKRPIYWLFDSGKKNGFKCLVYMHRYQPDTIARIRTDYVHEQQSRYRTAIADLQSRIDNAVSTSDRVKLSKKLKTIQEQDEELRFYEEKIHHLADQMIKIDLDDGVKVNYAKFQDVLAKIK